MTGSVKAVTATEVTVHGLAAEDEPLLRWRDALLLLELGLDLVRLRLPRTDKAVSRFCPKSCTPRLGLLNRLPSLLTDRAHATWHRASPAARGCLPLSS